MRPDHSMRPACAISTLGRWRKLAERSAKRPRGGAPAPATTTFGAIQRSGGSHSMGTRTSGQARPVARNAAAAAPAWRPPSAATSAVSAPCRRLPAANTPGLEVRSAVSTDGPRVPASIARPRHHSELVVGDPVGAEHDGVARHAAHAAALEVGELHLLHARSRRGSRSARCASRPGSGSAGRHRLGRARATDAAAAP